MKKSIFASTLIAAAALATPAFADELTWTGSSGDSWTGDTSWDSSTWVSGSDATFTSTGAGTVNVTESVTAGSVTIEGGNYTFNITGSLTTGLLTDSGSLTLTGSGTFKTQAAFSNDGSLVVDASEFTGTLEVDGYLNAGSSTFNGSMTVVMDASSNYTGDYLSDSNSISYGTAATGTYTFAANLSLTGTGGVIFRTSNSTITVSGNVTGDTGAELQKNGAGSLTFTGSVSLSTYINYQGSTTFKGSSTTLGTLEFAGDSGTSSSVTFSSSASVDAITVRSSNTFSGTLTVDNSATLTVGSISLGADTLEVTASAGTMIVTGNITVDGGKLSIGEGSTVTATGATGTTIQGIAGEGTLKLESSATGTQFTVTTDSSFTGTVNLVEGYLMMSGSSIAKDASLVVQASGTATDIGIYQDTNGTLASITYGADGATLDHDITVSGTGGVIIRSQNASYTGTFSGNITGEGAVYLQLNGNGSAIFTGDVTLEKGGYINYQGTTTFKDNTVILDSLAIYQTNTTTTSTVTFTGEEAAAEIGTLTIHSSEGTDAINLAVTADAAVQVGILEISHDIAITLDSGMLWVTDSVTQASGTSTTVTISGGGTLFLGDEVTLNATTISIVLSTENLAGEETYALFGTGSITSDAAIAVTVDSAVEQLLADGGEYTFSVYDTTLGLADSNFTADEIIAAGYDVTWNNDGTITIAVGAIPEPSMFGLMFGLGAIGLVATRRRRRA